MAQPLDVHKLLGASLNEIALEGRDGCSLETLWGLLDLEIDERTKLFLWKAIAMTPGFSIFDGCPTPSKGKKAKSPLSSATVSNWTLDQPQMKKLHIVAPDEMRWRMIGIDEPDSVPADPALLYLEAIGRARGKGTLMTEIAKKFDSTAQKVHHQVDKLLLLGLVKKHMVRCKVKDQSTNIRTNMLHTEYFAIEWERSIVGNQVQSEWGELVVERDQQQKKAFVEEALDQIEKAGRTAMVAADLCRLLGIHRRKFEVYRQYIESEHRQGRSRLQVYKTACRGLDGLQGTEREMWCVRLVPAENVAASAAASSAAATVQDTTSLVAGVGPVAELGLVQQLLGLIKGKKAAGATMPELREHLCMRGKRLYKVITDLATRYPVVSRKISVGRMNMFRLYHPRYDPETRPQQLLLEQGSGGGGEGRSVAVAPVRGSSAKKRRKSSTALVVTEVVAAPMLEEDGLSLIADVAEGAEGRADTPSAKQRKRKGKGAAGNGNAYRDRSFGGKNGMIKEAVSATTRQRQNHILERVHAESVVAVGSLHATMQALERAGGSTTDIDRRTIARQCEALQTAGQLLVLDVPLPDICLTPLSKPTMVLLVRPESELPLADREELLKDYLEQLVANKSVASEERKAKVQAKKVQAKRNKVLAVKGGEKAKAIEDGAPMEGSMLQIEGGENASAPTDATGAASNTPALAPVVTVERVERIVGVERMHDMKYATVKANQIESIQRSLRFDFILPR
jgi:hypothetical protein